MRGCFVDGQAFDALRNAEDFLDVARGALNHHEDFYGLEFDIRGHHVVLSPRGPHKTPVPDPLAVPAAPAPQPEPLERIRGARRLYDDRGVARGALLIRRPV